MSGRCLSVRLAISKPSTGYLRQTVVEQDGSFHFIPRVKDDLFGGGVAQFEWQEDNMLEVRMLAFKSEDQRKEIILRLLKFVTVLLDTNNLSASDEFSKRITSPSPNQSPSVHRKAILESASRATAYTSIPLVDVAPQAPVQQPIVQPQS
ncbi:hypothetical protein LTR72_006598 [Exophiala xenobiotica]|nr:hypothetical protein LTR72_006598 [Exophiala xenobiotica]KAK5475388.1 hypothetical protein LTR55_009392 [Exophiala xenobiotica]